MHRFYYNIEIKKQEKIILKEKEIINQIINVLRLKIGDSIILFDCIDNNDYIYKIEEINKKEIILNLEKIITKNSEINFELNIFQSLPNKISKIEYILQKGVEVGINKFIFFRSDRSQKLSLIGNKLERLNKIIIEAVEQSGGNKIPKLIINDFNISKNILNINKNSLNLFFHTKNDNSVKLKEINFSEKKEINLFVGPEGGFSGNEIELFLKNNFTNIYLGNRILRTETVSSVVGFFIGQII